jgi:hypothetical protein
MSLHSKSLHASLHAHGRDKPGHAMFCRRVRAALQYAVRYFGSAAIFGKNR